MRWGEPGGEWTEWGWRNEEAGADSIEKVMHIVVETNVYRFFTVHAIIIIIRMLYSALLLLLNGRNKWWMLFYVVAFASESQLNVVLDKVIPHRRLTIGLGLQIALDNICVSVRCLFAHTKLLASVDGVLFVAHSQYPRRSVIVKPDWIERKYSAASLALFTGVPQTGWRQLNTTAALWSCNPYITDINRGGEIESVVSTAARI